MRIGCLQFAPQVGDVDNNLNRADSVLSKANPEDLDVLVLPELAFSGYNFKSLQDITPFLEHSGSGISSLWARTVALKYNCYVTVGYPEKVDVSPMWPTGPEYYNSAIVVNGDGETVANYRKSFLYYTDETWALEGNKGFFDGYLPGLGNTSIGICMDLNPYKFEAPWHAFEFAFHVLEVESNLVIVSMAWMTREDPRRFSRMPNEPDMETLTYWVTRLEPIIRSDNPEEIIVVFCNRTGNEDEATYAGTSAVVGIHDGEVKVYGLLGRGEKELLVVDTNDAPYAKLVYRPDVEDSDRRSVSLDKASVQKDADAKAKERSSDKSPTATKSDRGNDTGKPGDPSSPKNQARSARAKSRDRSRSKGRLPGRQSPPPAPATSTLPPLPILPDNLVIGMKESLPKRRQAPSISIPPPGLISQGGSAKSPGTDSFDIPTPSAPSPTPMAVRPKLIIPESPSGKVYQYPVDQPISAFSERSERSIQSVRSDESEASVQTVKSNPRPPEDSTPYPHSGLPLSGYPGRNRIYGGHVTISHMEEFTPTTPFDDMSPASPRWFWKPPETILKTPVNGGAWQPGTPIGRKPEPFPWKAIKPSSRNQSRNGMRTPASTEMNHQEARQKHTQSPQSTSSSDKTKRSMSTSGVKQASTNGDPALARPSSPKSRNASRSRTNNRSNSSFSQHEVGAAVNQHLEFISLRAESVNKMRTESTNNTPIPDRPSSPKSRNCSRSRPTDTAELQRGQQTIHIAVSPSILNGEDGLPSADPPQASQTPQRSMSRLGHQRSNSFTSLSDKTFIPSTSSNIIRQTVRAASRGRQPGPKISPTHSDPTTSRRAPSVDTVMAEAYYSQFRNSSSQPLARRPGRRPSNGTGSHSRQNRVDLREFERFEAIICPNCPVHGRTASANNANDSPQPPYPDPIPSSLSHRDHGNEAPTPVPSRARDQKTPSPPAPKAESHKQRTEAPKSKEFISSSDSTSEPDVGRRPGQEVSTRPRSTPNLVPFNPTTPKAMAFSPTGFEPLPLSGGEALSPTRCAETEAVQKTDLPRGTTA